MTRVLVLGGRGLFGRTILRQLRALGLTAGSAGRHEGAEYTLDADDSQSIRSVLREGDLVIDAAGPFQRRTATLIDAALEVGFDLIDMNDHLGYAQKMLDRRQAIDNARLRVLSSASTVSTISATAIAFSEVTTPAKVTGFLAPASRHTANAGSARSLIRSIGQPIRVRRAASLVELPGWSESRGFDMPAPVGRMEGRLFETADSVLLPRIWPTLSDVDMFVDPRTFGVRSLLRWSMVHPWRRQLLERHVGFGTWLARKLGHTSGGVGYHVEGTGGEVSRVAIVSKNDSFSVATAPAVLAARAILQGRFPHRGLVPPHLHVEMDELWEFLQAAGITVLRW